MSGRSRPGTLEVSSSAANDLRMAYSWLRRMMNAMGSSCCAAVQIDWTEYWNDPSPMIASTGRLWPVWRSPSAMPTDAGRPPPRASPGAGGQQGRDYRNRRESGVLHGPSCTTSWAAADGQPLQLVGLARTHLRGAAWHSSCGVMERTLEPGCTL